MKKYVKKYFVTNLFLKMSNINFEKLKKALIYIKTNLIDSDNNMYLTVDLLIDISNITLVRIILL